MRRMLDVFLGLGRRWLNADARIVLPAVLAINLALTLYSHVVTLRSFPNSGDEYAYLLSAQLFSEGRLSAPSPESREFFDVVHVVNDGRFYGKYSPGWPLLLSAGVALGIPFLVNPLLGLLTQATIYATARRHFSRELANVALLFTLGNPLLILNAASYFSHPACLLFISLFLHHYLGCLDERAPRSTWFLMGLSAGAAFLVRPYTTVLIVGPLGLYRAWKSWRAKTLPGFFWNLAAAAPPFAALLAFFLFYNYRLTGSAFVQPFNHYDPNDHLGITPTSQTWAWGLRTNLLLRMYRLSAWLPFSVLFLLPFAAQARNRGDEKRRVLVALFLCLLGGYTFYLFDAKNEYGPRYMVESAGALLLVAACVTREFGRPGALVALAVLAMNGWMFREASVYHAEQVRDRMRVYDLVAEKKLTDALVFMSTGSGTMPSYDLTRNGVHFDGSVLYVKDMGRRNVELLARYPSRKAYCYVDRDGATPASLVPYFAEPAKGRR